MKISEGRPSLRTPERFSRKQCHRLFEYVIQCNTDGLCRESYVKQLQFHRRCSSFALINQAPFHSFFDNNTSAYTICT